MKISYREIGSFISWSCFQRGEGCSWVPGNWNCNVMKICTRNSVEALIPFNEKYRYLLKLQVPLR